MNFSSSRRLSRLECHAGVEIPDVPPLCDRHVARERTAVDEGDAVFAEKTVGAGIINEGRDEENPARCVPRDIRRALRDRRSSRGPTPACDPRGRTITGNARPSDISVNARPALARRLASHTRLAASVSGISRPGTPSSNRQSLSRSRLATRVAAHSAAAAASATRLCHLERIAALLGVGSHHDRHVMIG